MPVSGKTFLLFVATGSLKLTAVIYRLPKEVTVFLLYYEFATVQKLMCCSMSCPNPVQWQPVMTPEWVSRPRRKVLLVEQPEPCSKRLNWRSDGLWEWKHVQTEWCGWLYVQHLLCQGTIVTTCTDKCICYVDYVVIVSDLCYSLCW